LQVQTADVETSPESMNHRSDRETVSVVIPCFNEERYIGQALDQLADQYDSDSYEIIIIDGLSTDRTRDVIDDFRQRRSDVTVTVVDNPARNIPTALNLGVRAARGQIIARMDAHAVPTAGYVRRCVDVLQEGRASVVGMPCNVLPGDNSSMARAIAVAVSHPFGIGDATYRLGKSGPLQEPVDTVAFACFRKSLWNDLGGFNEALLTNEDYDFNYRVRQSGKEVILDRSGHCDYFARTSLGSLGRQYLRYGGWKAEMIRLQPGSIKLRHLVAPLFVLSLFLLILLSLFLPLARWLLLAEVVTYLFFALVAGWLALRKARVSLAMLPIMPVIFATIHLTWGTSFLFRILVPARTAPKVQS